MMTVSRLARGGIPFGGCNTNALFSRDERSLGYLQSSEGFEIGVGPNVEVADKGFAKSYTSNTLTQDVHAFAFNQTGLMAGLGLTGSRITRIAAP